MKDRVEIKDRLFLNRWETHTEPVRAKEPILIEGFFSCVARERGKLVPRSRREGFNIWTSTGREYLAQLMSYSFYGANAHDSGLVNPDLPYRDDRIRYFGFGTGIQPEVSEVPRLVTPITFNGGAQFLAQTGLPTFPLSPSRSTASYARTYSETELSVIGSVILTEAGLFTDGSPTSAYAPKTRDISLASAALQAPVAYKSIEPFKKTQNFALEVVWEIMY